MDKDASDRWLSEASDNQEVAPTSKHHAIARVDCLHAPLPLYESISPFFKRPSHSDIFASIKSENFSWFRTLLSSRSASLRDVDEIGRTLMHYAVRWEEGSQFCRFLLDHGAGAQLDVIPHRSSWTFNKEATPLHVSILAVCNKRELKKEIPEWVYERITWLLEAGADVHRPDSRGISCFDLIFGIDDHRLKSTVIPYADIDVLACILVTKVRGRPLLLQWLQDSPESTLANLSLLIEHGANPAVKNSLGQNCLHLCVEFADSPRRSTELRRGLVELIKHGADVNAKDHNGNTVTDVAFHRRDPQGILGTYPGDLWACTLVACGHDVFVNFQNSQSRLPRFGSGYTPYHLTMLWQDIEDNSYIFTNVVNLPKEKLDDTLPEVLTFIRRRDLRRLLDLRPSFFEASVRYQWITELQETELDTKSIQTILVSRAGKSREGLFRPGSGVRSKRFKDQHSDNRLPDPEFHHTSCCHQETLQVRPSGPDTWMESANLPDLSLIHWHMIPLAQHFFRTGPIEETGLYAHRVPNRATRRFGPTSLYTSHFPNHFSNHLINGLNSESVGLETWRDTSATDERGLQFFKTVWRDILYLASEWQSAGICCDRITMMIHRGSNQVDLQPIILEHLLGVYEELDSFPSVFAADVKRRGPPASELGDELDASTSAFSLARESLDSAAFITLEDEERFSCTADLYRTLFHDLPGVISPDDEFLVPSSQTRTLHHLCLLTQAISISMLLYGQCHIGNFHPYFLTDPVSIMVLGGYDVNTHPKTSPGSDKKQGDEISEIDHENKGNLVIIARLQSLKCAGNMLGKPTFIFTTTRSQTEPAMLYGSCEDIVDTFGQSSIISTDPDNRFNTLVGIRIRGGTIFPTKDMYSPEKRLFHWGAFPTSVDEAIIFGYTEKILIGAPFTNGKCKLEEEKARQAAKAAGALSLVHVLKPFWFEDQIQAGLQAGQYVSLTAGVVWKCSPGRSLKEAILQGYALNRSLNFLNNLSGLQFSICTGLARRVPLRQLVVESPLFDMLDYAGIEGWDGVKEHARDLFKHPISPAILNHDLCFPSKTLHKVFQIILGHLEPTGVGMDGQLRILWPAPDEPAYCFVADPEKHPHLQWCHMVRDNEWCATFAAMTAMCIETEGHRCPSRDATAPWRVERSVLSTGIFQPGAADTELKVGASYWVGDSGSGVWVTVREPEQGTQVLTLNKRIPPGIPRFAWRILGWEALRECYMRETLSTDVVVYSKRRSR